MALVLDKASATMTVDKAGARAAIAVGNKSALLHCTRNVRIGFVDAPGTPDPTGGPSIRITGKVFIKGNPSSSEDRLAISKWQAAIVQVSTVMVYELRFAGRMKNEGSMIANLRAGFSPNPSFDGKAASLNHAFDNSSYTVTQVHGTNPGFLFSVNHDDGPFTFITLKFENMMVNAPNYIYSARRDEGFVTYLVVREPNGTTHFVSHVGWHTIWHGEFQWKNPGEKPLVIMKNSVFNVGLVRLGEPAVADAGFAMAKNPNGATANELDRRAIESGFINRNSAILVQSKDRPNDLPGIFF